MSQLHIFILPYILYLIRLQSTMFGGTLNNKTAIITQSLDLLLAAFSHTIYIFNISQGALMGKISIHQANIMALSYSQPFKYYQSLDQKGCLIRFQMSQIGVVKNAVRSNKIFGNQIILEATILQGLNQQIQIYALLQSGRLVKHCSGSTMMIAQGVKQIMHISQRYIIFKITTTEIDIYDCQTLQTKLSYEHESLITAIEVCQQNLIVGDEKGKIYVLHGFLNNGQIQLTQKLQWHIHQITSLTIDGQYLYSTGEEGVIVLWHLRENRKDFLPRIGAKINQIKLSDSKIYCFLADNSIKSIDLNNDKVTVNFKVVLSPNFSPIAQQSSQLIRSNLIRVSKNDDKIYMRAFPGKIQQINLCSGGNIDIQIISRNVISRLDKHYPSPHQITDICFNEDNSMLSASVQGINCKSLRFYQLDKQQYSLMCKIQNCHEGSAIVSLLYLKERHQFLSYSHTDCRIKLWSLIKRTKLSILDIYQFFWSCQSEINYRSKIPVSVNICQGNLIITFENQFIIINTESKVISNTYQLKANYNHFINVVALKSSKSIETFIVLRKNNIELIQLENKQFKCAKQLLSKHQNEVINPQNVRMNKQQTKLSLIIQAQDKLDIYIFGLNTKDNNHFEVTKNADSTITDIFWLGERLIAIDTSLNFYDLTHNQELLSLSKRKTSDIQSQVTFEEDEQNLIAEDYDTLQNRYLERFYRKQKNPIEKSLQIISISPSIALSFSHYAKNMFI